jgi:hypothetical protein
MSATQHQTGLQTDRMSRPELDGPG